MSNERPVARIYQRDIISKDRHLKGTDGEPLVRHLGRETVRQAACDDPVHGGRRTTVFIGVNAAGWIFRCAGRGRDSAHLLLATPPVDTTALNQVDPGGSE
jgi:hypothetical protein